MSKLEYVKISDEEEYEVGGAFFGSSDPGVTVVKIEKKLGGRYMVTNSAGGTIRFHEQDVKEYR